MDRHVKWKAKLKRYVASRPMQIVALYILGPLPVTNRGNKYVLIVADHFTKWVEAFVIPDQRAETVAVGRPELHLTSRNCP